MSVMATRARVRVPVFERAHALMKRIHITCNVKTLLGRDGDDAHWLTLICIPGSLQSFNAPWL